VPYKSPRWLLGASTALISVYAVSTGWPGRTALLVGCALFGSYLLIQESIVRSQTAGFRDFLERMAEWAMVVQVDGQVVFVTKGAQQYGFPLRDIIKGHWRDHLPENQHHIIGELLASAEAAKSGVAGPACGQFDLPRGDTRTFETTVYRYIDVRSLQYVIVFRDITAKQRLSEGLAHLDRNAAIAHVASGVAHNFNNILAGIMLNAGLLADATGPDQQRLAERVIASAEKGADLCRKLLRFTRDEKPSLGPVPVEPLLADSVTLFETEANRHAISIAWSAERDLIIKGDRNQVQQILLSFFFNAREAIGRDGRITVAAVRANSGIRIAVSNSGPPIPPEQMPLIFLPFFSTKTHVVQGIGMGLAVSQGLAAGMGGHIEVQSPEEGPVCFTLVLPAFA
jgi:signal transduction histidine kinase